MRIITKGLIVREQHTGENDRIITVLTRDKGVVRAFATGARRIQHKNSVGTQLLCYSDLTLFRGKDSYRVDEAVPIEVFFALRGDIVRLSLAQYFCELARFLCPEEAEAQQPLRLLLCALKFLCDDAYPMEQIKAVVELRLMAESGYLPDLVGCAVCGGFEGEPMFLDRVGGRIYCPHHRAQAPETDYLLSLSAGVLAAMRHIAYSDFSRVFRFTLPEESMRALSEVTERYLCAQADRTFGTLSFYRSL